MQPNHRQESCTTRSWPRTLSRNICFSNTSWRITKTVRHPSFLTGALIHCSGVYQGRIESSLLTLTFQYNACSAFFFSPVFVSVHVHPVVCMSLTTCQLDPKPRTRWSRHAEFVWCHQTSIRISSSRNPNAHAGPCTGPEEHALPKKLHANQKDPHLVAERILSSSMLPSSLEQKTNSGEGCEPLLFQDVHQTGGFLRYLWK